MSRILDKRFSDIVVCLLLLAVVVGVTVTARVRLLNMPLERDEGEYAYLGRQIRQGIAPYTQAYNIKMPGIYLVYALSMTLFGESTSGIRIGLLIANLLSTVLVVWLAAMMLGDTIAGAMAGISWLVLSHNPLAYAFTAHATAFIVPCWLGSLIALRYFEARHKIWLLAVAALLGGCGFLIKQPAAVFGLLGCLVVVIDAWQPGPGRLRRIGGRLIVWSTMFLVPAAVTALYYLLIGSFGPFWFWTVSYALTYGSGMTVAAALRSLAQGLEPVVQPTIIVWGAALAGAFLPGPDRRTKTTLVLFSAAAAAASSFSLYFRPHYFILFLPAVAIWAAWALRSLSRLRLAGHASGALLAVIVLVMSAVMVFTSGARVFASTPAQASRLLYGANPFPESIPAASYLRALTKPGDRIAVLGSEPQLYFLSQRDAACGYLYMYDLVRTGTLAERMQRDCIAQIESVRPAALVVVNLQISWLQQTGSSKELISWMGRYIGDQYRLSGIIDVLSKDYIGEVRTVSYDRPMIIQQSGILIFERRDQPAAKGR